VKSTACKMRSDNVLKIYLLVQTVTKNKHYVKRMNESIKSDTKSKVLLVIILIIIVRIFILLYQCLFQNRS